ncbi:MAG: hypothetical protein K2L95_03130 [Alphaproteobacteria bacterium]|nr:hypothetical protein [Alphaproteobacteria bacterium]
MTETQRQNARARAAGGYRVMPSIIRNKSADVFYRNAIDKETDRMLSAIFDGLARVYTSIRVDFIFEGQVKNIPEAAFFIWVREKLCNNYNP